MTTALATKEPAALAPTVSAEQLELVKRTIANGATPAELQLYLYDCARQGVHPLDRLLHFTKRGGKYTPVTSIDLMRIRASETGEYAGSDDATFDNHDLTGNPPHSATVTVWRLVQGQRCAFTATARWSEYCPASGSDHMWRKMPHTMLAKCAEALALRKGFPRQLAGLYAKEEMDQAADRGGYTVEAPAPSVSSMAPVAPDPGSGALSVPNSGDSGRPVRAAIPSDADLSDGSLTIRRVEMRPTKNANVKKYVVVLSDGREVTTIKERLGSLCERLAQDGDPVTVDTKSTRWGEDLIGVRRVETLQASEIPFGDENPPMPTDDDLVPF